MSTINDRALRCELSAFGQPAGDLPHAGDRTMEFHVHTSLRAAVGVSSAFFRTTGNLIIPDFRAARNFAARLRELESVGGQDTTKLSAGKLNAMGLIDEILHLVIGLYREKVMPDVLAALARDVEGELGPAAYGALLREFSAQFSPSDVYQGVASVDDWLEGSSSIRIGGPKISNRELALEELILLKLANENPAFAPFRFLFDDGLRGPAALPGSVGGETKYREAFAALDRASAALPHFGPSGSQTDLLSLLRAPAREAPDSLEAQLAWMRGAWGAEFNEIGIKILQSLDLIAEEEAPRFPPGPGPAQAYRYSSGLASQEYEKFTQDKDWMPSLILLAKNVLVWLHQLSAAYGQPITRLDQVPDQELDTIARRGINGLWLIGIWERSPASEKIKRLCGNPEAAASAYALFDYEIAPELGGWAALDALRERCLWRGIRLAADMVPNHTGIDSAWVRERPDLFIGSDHCPFPSYTFNGPDLSGDPSIGIWLEDHYYSRSDAAVVFKRQDRRTGKIRYLYHGNDGTGMAWNDTAQIDFLNPEAREAVKERIRHVAAHFSIIRFDAAMVLARQHIRRLWYPAPGSGGAIPSRAEHSIPEEIFTTAMPHEFWREVVDESAISSPDTLLLAEAFWMMEGYFTRTLGMHRVYNSAFMNMLKDEKNSLYRLTIKNTQEFDKQILKRFVNFMSNPDEETAIAQFGDGDKYFGVCTLLATMPGTPMIGHGQIEGFVEKYGMEYRRSYRDETPNQGLIERHEREIFPLLRMRKLFAEVDNFQLFDFASNEGHVDENVFAYSNGSGERRALVFYNNCWKRTSGRVISSCAFAEKDSGGRKHLRTLSLAQTLGLEQGPGNYLAAYELRSRRWYVYRCADLASQGWQANLEGYQTLVFTDFTRVHDLDGNYARLWASLKGQGVEDLDDALEIATRPELYNTLEKAIDAILGCEGALRSGKPAAEQAAAAALRAEHYFSRLAQALIDEGGPAPGIAAVSKGRAIVEQGIAALGALFGEASPEHGAEPGERAAAEFPAERAAALEKFRTILGSGRGSRAFLYYVFIAGLAGLDAGANQSNELRYVLEKFLVRKKMMQAASRAPAEKIAGALGAVGDEAVCALVFAFATRPQDKPALPQAPRQSARQRAAELMRWVLFDGEARASLGVNAWEGVEYFNKERFEALVELWPCFAVMERFLAGTAGTAGTPATGASIEQALADAVDPRSFQVAELLRMSEELSGFKCATLLSILDHD
jgi:glycosidase